MGNTNPIRTVCELEFDTPPIMGYGLCHNTPDYLRISPNGRYIVIGNLGRYYLFDTCNPKQSWRERAVKGPLSMVSPTNSGGCWIERDGNILFVNADDHEMHEFTMCHFKRCWGDDDWILIHTAEALYYATRPNFIFHTVEHDLIILHAWQYEKNMRILSISNNKKRLFLHAWNIETDDYQLLTTTRYKHNFGINGINAIYQVASHVHAIPETNGSVTIKLMPWAISVSTEGEMTISDNHVAWVPIIDSTVGKNNAIERQKMAEITAGILEGRFDPSAGFGSTPYLIATLQTSDSINVITSLGHKSILINQIDQLSDEALDESLDDIDIATMVLASSETTLPQTENMASSISEMLESDSFKNKYKRLLKKKEKQIIRLVKKCFTQSIAELAHKLGTDEEEALGSLFDDGLKELVKHKWIARAFFEALNSSEVNPEVRHVVKSAICNLVPFLPKKVVRIIPEELREKPEPILDIILRVSPDVAAFFIGKAPQKEFNAKSLAKLLHHFCVNTGARKRLSERMGDPKLFCGNTDVLDKLLEKIHTQSKIEDISREPELTQALESMLFGNDTLIPQALIRILKAGVPIPNTLHDPKIDFIQAMSCPQTPFDKIAFILADLDTNAPHISPEILDATIENIQRKRIIPSCLIPMSQLVYAQSKSDLMSITNIKKGDVAYNYAIVEHLWDMAKSATPLIKSAYASCLIKATTRCLGEQALGDIASGLYFNLERDIITSEAKLLQTSKSKSSNSVVEMRACMAVTDFHHSETKGSMPSDLALSQTMESVQ